MKSLFRSVLIVAGGAAMPAALSAQVLAGATNSNGAGSASDASPVIQFSSESYDFGKILAGETIYYTNVVTNGGCATLDISAVKPSCSCTVVGGSWTPHIAPNQTGIIPIAIHTTPGTRGQIDKTVMVTSNDKTRPNVTLHIHGLVWLPIEVTPNQTAFFSVKPDVESVAPQVLKIFNRTDEPLTLSAPQSSKAEFTADLTTNTPGQEFELSITVKPPPRSPNARGTTFLQSAITLNTSSTNMPVLTINAMANVQPEIEVLPGQIQLATGPLTNGFSNWITIRGNTSNALTLSDPRVTVSGGSPVFAAEDIRDLPGVIDRVRREADPVSAFLWHNLSNPDQSLLLNYLASAPNSNEARGVVLQALNKAAASPSLYDAERFKEVPLRPETAALVNQNSTGPSLAPLNRSLLEDAYPLELSRRVAAETALKVLTPDRAYSLLVNFPRGFEIKPGESVIVSVNTDNPRSRTITVPVFPMQPARRPLIPTSPAAAPVAQPTPAPTATRAAPTILNPPTPKPLPVSTPLSATRTPQGSIVPPMPPTPTP
ncbi:MAG: DUF1573 domain-containing protein [Verrucomicrobiota bacterium]|jgi:hypothetical protein